jgi:excinuclease ABC subunit B
MEALSAFPYTAIRDLSIMPPFQLVSPYEPRGDQSSAIHSLVQDIQKGKSSYHTLLGVTGSGKTFTMANVIERLKLPTLVLTHNKTLAAQLYSEFRDFFPENAVEYFVSYYDYYQPEAYIPQRDIYIEKDASINENLDRLRLAATSALLTREDVVIVSSVSCIYGLGSPSDYSKMLVRIETGDEMDRDELLEKFVLMQYERGDVDFRRGTFRVRGDVVEIFPSYQQEQSLRIEFFGDEIESLLEVDPLTGEVLQELGAITVFPAKHFVLPQEKIQKAVRSIEDELLQHLQTLRSQGKLLEAQRLEARTRYDLEMLQEVGNCKGIENYSRHLTGRAPGERPDCLLDYFQGPFLTILDESHVTVPQIGGMFAGDRSRKNTLVEHGFRLPSALDNRPLSFQEWESVTGTTLFVSATPNDYELKRCEGVVVEQIIRPTGLVDPVIRIEPATNQVPHLITEIRKRRDLSERVLVTTLTKRLSEDLSLYLTEQGLRVQYLHSELDAFERVEILEALRRGEFECVVGINLLREGLDLPEVSLVAILDADKEGFLRSQTSLIQTIGRCARHVNAEVILYADRMTGSMQRAIDETERRRQIQLNHNKIHGITPQSVEKAFKQTITYEAEAHKVVRRAVSPDRDDRKRTAVLEELEREMQQAAKHLEFERAAALRDRIFELRNHHPATNKKPPARKRRRRRS